MNTLTLIILSLSLGFDILLGWLLFKAWRDNAHLRTELVMLRLDAARLFNAAKEVRRSFIKINVCFWIMWLVAVYLIVREYLSRKKNANQS